MRKLLLIGVVTLSILGCEKESLETIETNQVWDTCRFELTVIELREFYNLRAIRFIDNNTGFASGYNGSLIKTTDGGVSWSKLEINTSNKIGFVVGGDQHSTPPGAVMLKTMDGGNIWEEVVINLSSKELKSVRFINDSVGFAIGSSSILKTTDGGSSWEEKIIKNLGGKMSNISFNTSQIGMISCSGSGGKIVSTTDGGNSWDIISSLPVSGLTSISITEDNVVYASGGNEIFKSVDFGYSWIELANSPTGIFDIDFITQDFGFAVGRGIYSGGCYGYHCGAISYTTDKGKNWTEKKDILEAGIFLESSFPSKNLGYIVSSNTIIKVSIK